MWIWSMLWAPLSHLTITGFSFRKLWKTLFVSVNISAWVNCVSGSCLTRQNVWLMYFSVHMPLCWPLTSTDWTPVGSPSWSGVTVNGGEQMSCHSVPHLLFNMDLLALEITGFIHKSRKHQSMESITRRSVSSDEPRERPRDKDLRLHLYFAAALEKSCFTVTIMKDVRVAVITALRWNMSLEEPMKWCDRSAGDYDMRIIFVWTVIRVEIIFWHKESQHIQTIFLILNVICCMIPSVSRCTTWDSTSSDCRRDRAARTQIFY